MVHNCRQYYRNSPRCQKLEGVEIIRLNWRIFLGILLIILSAVVYFLHWVIFRDPHHIFIYMVGDLAFLPLEVLIVVLLIERILSRREKQTMLQKLNMVIGAFFLAEIIFSLLFRSYG